MLAFIYIRVGWCKGYKFKVKVTKVKVVLRKFCHRIKRGFFYMNIKMIGNEKLLIVPHPPKSKEPQILCSKSL